MMVGCIYLSFCLLIPWWCLSTVCGSGGSGGLGGARWILLSSCGPPNLAFSVLLEGSAFLADLWVSYDSSALLCCIRGSERSHEQLVIWKGTTKHRARPTAEQFRKIKYSSADITGKETAKLISWTLHKINRAIVLWLSLKANIK